MLAQTVDLSSVSSFAAGSARMNPYYTHESEVGSVYDVASYSRFKPIATALAALAFAFFSGLGAVYFWNPDLIDPNPSEIWVEAHQDAKDLMTDHPIGTKVGVGLSALFSALCLAMSLSCICNSISGNYHIRVGEGGVSLRVPDALWGVLEKDIPWSEISALRVIQEKRLGALSRCAGNLGGEIEKLHGGQRVGSLGHVSDASCCPIRG